MKDKNAMGTLILICGKICSGKTRYAKILQRERDAVLFSSDELIRQIIVHCPMDEFFSIEKRVREYLLGKATEVVERGITALLDFGFWNAEERKLLEKNLSEREIAHEWHYVKVDEKTWHKNILFRNALIEKGECNDYFIQKSDEKKYDDWFEEPQYGMDKVIDNRW